MLTCDRVLKPRTLENFHPCLLHLMKGRHIGHGTASSEVWQNDTLIVRSQYISGFCHKVNPTKHDVSR